MTDPRIADLFELQNGFNCRVDPSWLNLGFAFHRAIWMECGELVEGTNGWKWWKAHGDFKEAQLQLEVVDILHFLLSWALVEDHASSGTQNSERLANALLSIETSATWCTHTVIECAEVVAGAAAQRDLAQTTAGFIHLAGATQLDLAALYRMYVAKNALNTFRNRHGYASGMYMKTWAGVEDNVHLEELMKAEPNISFGRLMTLLERRYLDCLSETAW